MYKFFKTNLFPYATHLNFLKTSVHLRMVYSSLNVLSFLAQGYPAFKILQVCKNDIFLHYLI